MSRNSGDRRFGTAERCEKISQGYAKSAYGFQSVDVFQGYAKSAYPG